MECAGHIKYYAPSTGICKYAASSKLCRLYGSSSSEISLSASQMMSYIDVSSQLTALSRVNSFGEYRLMMIKAYRGPLSIHPLWYELALGNCHSHELDAEPSHGEEHDVHDTA